MLNDYLQSLQGFVRDRSQRTWNPQDLIRYVNRARREIAMRTQCIRRVPPTSGSVATIHVVSGGTGYTAPVVEISSPDLPNGQALYPNGAQATAAAQIIGGIVSNVSVSFGGSGYFQPTAEIADPHGTGAVLSVQTSPINSLLPNQEEYKFASLPVSTFPGVASVFAVLDCAILYNNLRYQLNRYAFSEYQAFIRNYPFQYSYVPVCYTQLGDGAQGALLFYPFPSQKYAFEPDCLCLPIDLRTDNDFEAIGEPWTEAVPFLAAAYAYEEAQNLNTARYWHDRAKESIVRYSAYARPRMISSFYGRR